MTFTIKTTPFYKKLAFLFLVLALSLPGMQAVEVALETVTTPVTLSKREYRSNLTQRIAAKSFNETFKKLFDRANPITRFYFALQAKIGNATAEQNLPLGSTNFATRAAEELIPVTLATMARFTRIVIDDGTIKAGGFLSFSPRYRDRLACEILKKVVSSRFFTSKETSLYNKLGVVARLATFFDAAVLIDPMNAKDYVNIPQGVVIYLGEKVVENILVPFFKKYSQADDITAKGLARTIIEDMASKPLISSLRSFSNEVSWRLRYIYYYIYYSHYYEIFGQPTP